MGVCTDAASAGIAAVEVGTDASTGAAACVAASVDGVVLGSCAKTQAALAKSEIPASFKIHVRDVRIGSLQRESFLQLSLGCVR
jgi:hypothetical protein